MQKWRALLLVHSWDSNVAGRCGRLARRSPFAGCALSQNAGGRDLLRRDFADRGVPPALGEQCRSVWLGAHISYLWHEAVVGLGGYLYLAPNGAVGWAASPWADRAAPSALTLVRSCTGPTSTWAWVSWSRWWSPSWGKRCRWVRLARPALSLRRVCLDYFLIMEKVEGPPPPPARIVMVLYWVG